MTAEIAEKSFLKTIGQYPQLDPIEETRLALLWRNEGDSGAAEILVLSTSGLVYHIASKYAGYGFPKMDLVQEGMLGAMHAVKKFDPTKGYRLSTYATWWIRASIQEYIMRMWRIVRPSLSKKSRDIFNGLSKSREIIALLDSDSDTLLSISESYDMSVDEYKVAASYFIDGDVVLEDCPELPGSISAEEEVSNEESEKVMESVIGNSLDILNKRERDVVSYRFLGQEKLTLREIASRLDVSIARVSQIEKSAMVKLRKDVTSSNVLDVIALD